MTNHQEVMRMALELLTSAHVSTALVWPRHDCVEALRAALAEPDTITARLTREQHGGLRECLYRGAVTMDEYRRLLALLGDWPTASPPPPPSDQTLPGAEDNRT